MLVIYNDCSVVNMKNVTRFTKFNEYINFYFVSGETHSFKFESDSAANAAFENICRCYSTEHTICRVAGNQKC